MAEKFEYEVLRQMDGDKQYFQGDTRVLEEHEASHLVALGVLKKLGPAKQEPVPENKAEGAAPETKVDGAKSKGKNAKQS